VSYAIAEIFLPSVQSGSYLGIMGNDMVCPSFGKQESS